MRINIDKTIKMNITDHPTLSWNGIPVTRTVEFLGYSVFEPKDERISLFFRITNKFDTDEDTWRVRDIVYDLKNNIYINVTTPEQAENAELVRDINNNIATSESDIPENIAYMTELDYWFNLMANQPVADALLIQQAIVNLDTYQNYFDDKY